jgi:hypothetical protein
MQSTQDILRRQFTHLEDKDDFIFEQLYPKEMKTLKSRVIFERKDGSKFVKALFCKNHNSEKMKSIAKRSENSCIPSEILFEGDDFSIFDSVTPVDFSILFKKIKNNLRLKGKNNKVIRFSPSTKKSIEFYEIDYFMKELNNEIHSIRRADIAMRKYCAYRFAYRTLILDLIADIFKFLPKSESIAKLKKQIFKYPKVMLLTGEHFKENYENNQSYYMIEIGHFVVFISYIDFAKENEVSKYNLIIQQPPQRKALENTRFLFFQDNRTEKSIVFRNGIRTSTLVCSSNGNELKPLFFKEDTSKHYSDYLKEKIAVFPLYKEKSLVFIKIKRINFDGVMSDTPISFRLTVLSLNYKEDGLHEKVLYLKNFEDISEISSNRKNGKYLRAIKHCFENLIEKWDAPTLFIKR